MTQRSCDVWYLSLAGPDQETSRHWPNQKNWKPKGWSRWCEKAQMVQRSRLGRCLLQVLPSVSPVLLHLPQKTTYPNPPNSPNPQIGSVSSCHSSENWNRRWCQNWNTRATRPTLTTTLRTTWTKFLASVKGSRESLMTFDHFIS